MASHQSETRPGDLPTLRLIRKPLHGRFSRQPSFMNMSARFGWCRRDFVASPVGNSPSAWRDCFHLEAVREMLAHACKTRKNPSSRWVLRITLLVLLALAPSGAMAGAVPLLSVHQLAMTAELIMVGRVGSLTSRWNMQGTQIVTRIEVEPEEIWKGSMPTDRPYFVQPGGRVGNRGSVLADAPSFAEHERVVLFLTRRREGELTVIALFQGKFTVEQDPASGPDMAVRRAPGSAQILDRMTLDALRSEVRAALGK